MHGLRFCDIERLIAALNCSGHTYSLTTVQSNDTPVEKIRCFWQSLGVTHIDIKGLHRRGGYLELGRSINGNQALGNYIPRAYPKSDSMAEDACHKLYMFLHVNTTGQILPCVQEINASNVIGTISSESMIDCIVALTRSYRPTFNICSDCELKQQDLMQYYAKFFAERFINRLPIWQERLETAERCGL